MFKEGTEGRAVWLELCDWGIGSVVVMSERPASVLGCRGFSSQSRWCVFWVLRDINYTWVEWVYDDLGMREARVGGKEG